MLEFIILHKVEILSALLAVSEVLAFIPQVSANGVLDALIKGLKALLGVVKPPQA